MPLLERAFADLLDRHKVLKTRLSYVGSSPVQSRGEGDEQILQLIELSSTAGTGNGKDFSVLLNEEYQAPIDLNGGLLFKATLVTNHDSDWLLILKMHHIISDATTFQILWKDLKSIYNFYLDGGGTLPPLTLDYHDYALWQRSVFDSPHTGEQEAYWLEQFTGEVPELDLPADFSAPGGINFRGAVERLPLPKELIKGLESFSLQERVVLFSTLLAAYYILLQKYCRQDDIVIGTVFSGRHYTPDIRHVAGFFVNTVAIRISQEDDLPFETLLKKIHGLVTNAYKMQDYPFERLVDKVNPERAYSRNPLFRAMFNVVTTYRENLTFTGIQAEQWEEPEINSTQVDLFLDLHIDPENPDVRIEYNTDLFRPETIRRILTHYTNLLHRILENPGVKTSQLDLLGGDEREQLLRQWTGVQDLYPQDRFIHHWIAGQVERHPQHTALLFKNDILSYGELEYSSSRLARLLSEEGVIPGSIVAIQFERSFAMVIAILAVLNAGGAYLPMDPHWPAERSNFMLADSHAGLLLVPAAEEKQEVLAGTNKRIKQIRVGNEMPTPMPEPGLPGKNQPGDLAYILYTSGSTGRPKAVMVEHRSIMNTLYFLQQTYPLGKNDTYLLKTSYTFDVAISELFGWCFGGGRLAILEPGGEKDPHALVQAIKEYHITHINFVPSMLEVFLDRLKDEDAGILEGLKCLFAAGEALTPHLVKKFHDRVDRVWLENLYGPTEASIYGTWYSLSRSPDPEEVPIGKPVANMRAYVLDSRLDIQPQGVPGELGLSGIGLARGYLNNPELTAEKFVCSPFIPGERIYRTGDLVRWQEDGNLRFYGRLDHQVKIRGFRVELGEIEKRLLCCPAVGQALVTVRQGQGEQSRLTAYLVVKPRQDFSVDRLREVLGKWLPEYMIPVDVVKLPAFPLNASGKIDRRALPAPESVETETPRQPGELSASPAPPSATEQKLIDITEAILGLKGLDANSNFFRLGGNSLLTIRFAAEIESAFGVTLEIIDFIDLPPIVQIAKTIDAMLPAPG